MNALRMLSEQHDQIDELFERIADAEGNRKRKLVLEMVDMLAMHGSIEERHFYPAVSIAGQTEALVIEALDEHAEMKRSLAALLETDVDVAAFDERIENLKAEFQRHVTEEEGELFPKVERLLSAETLEAIGHDMIATMVEMAENEPRNDIPEPADPLPALH